MSSENNKKVARLVTQAQSIQRQMDRLASELERLKIEIEKEENSSQELKIGDLVKITSRNRYGTRCVVQKFTAQRVIITTINTNEQLIRKATNLELIKKK